MPLFPCLFLLALYRNVNVVDQTYQVPPGAWRYVDSADWRYPAWQSKAGPAIIHAAFTVASGPSVRLMVMDRAGLNKLERGESPALLRQTAAATTGTLRQRTGSPNDCILVLENRGSQAAAIVRLTVSVDSWDAPELSPGRRLAVLAVSFGVFFGLVGYSAGKLRRVFTK